MRIPEHLFAQAQAGDPRSLERLLVSVRPHVRRYAVYQCRRSSAVDDVVQEALIILYRRLHSVRSVTSLAGWLLKVVMRLCMLPALVLIKGVEELRSIEDSKRFSHVPADDLRMDLVRALESLSAPHREVILLRDLQERTIGEIAQMLGITREATKSRLHRARTLVREYLRSGTGS